MIGDLLRTVVKETVLLPVNVVKGVGDAVEEITKDI